MKLFRLILAILLALLLGLAPVFAGAQKPSAAAMQGCMGKAKSSCPCDGGSMPCGTASCKIACSGVLGVVATVESALVQRSVVVVAASVSGLRSIRPWYDPPVPRS